MLEKQANNEKGYNFLILLCMLFVTVDLASNVVAYKIVIFGPLVQTGAAFIYPLTYFFGDIIAEVYGYKISRQLIWFDFACSVLFSLATLTVIKLPSPNFWHDQAAYNTVLGALLLVNLGTAMAAWTGGIINVYLVTKLKILMGGKHFWIRSILSTSIGEAIAIIAGFFIVFSTYASFSNILKLMLADYIIKLAYAVILVLPATFIQSKLKKLEDVDVFDYKTNFNPFRINTLNE